jgi:hypothetical protein
VPASCSSHHIFMMMLFNARKLHPRAERYLEYLTAANIRAPQR